MLILKKTNIFKLILTVWLVLWLFFLIREDKDNQYQSLGYLYTHGYDEKIEYLLGGELYDFLVFCRGNMPEGSTYEILGFEKFSIKEVRARYFMWPLKSVGEDPDFKIVHGGQEADTRGYKEHKEYGPAGRLLIRGDVDK